MNDCKFDPALVFAPAWAQRLCAQAAIADKVATALRGEDAEDRP